MDTALKQRLIGAVVLVALAVIFLPMLIKGPAPDSGVSDVPLDVPATPGGQYETRELPLVTPGDAPAGGVVGMGNGAQPAPAATSEAIPLGAAPAAPAANGMLPASTAGGNYAVNFGAYATPADADAVIARLKQSSLPAFREPATINGRNAYRVRIGPYGERADAEAVRLQATQVRSDVKAQVVTLDATNANPAPAVPTPAPAPSVAQATPAPATVTTQALPPEAPKPAPAVTKPVATTPVATAAKPATPAPKPETLKPAASSVGFAVQLGAFSQASDANAMRDKLRAGGFSAFVEQVRTDKGTLNRVRVGPVASRADADRLKAQVSAKVGIDGMVRPHP
ncbi:MAG: SPOR domain-containing protein [Lysobacteraceae bacterium]|nr:MAG: SPOR domain-containing protein [Xanthomonadaceae bacterium]